MSEVKLLLCPFCGSSNLEDDWGAVVCIYAVDHQTCEINCEDCDKSVTIRCTEEDGGDMRQNMVKAYNTRHNPLTARVAELEEALRFYADGIGYSEVSDNGKIARKALNNTGSSK